MKKRWPLTLILTLLLVTACSIDDELNDTADIETTALTLTEILSDNDLITAKRPQPPIYADCDKYTGLVVPSTFKPTSGNFDELYGGTMFKDNYPLISDSKPGDQDYNGGRWHMNLLKDDVDPMKYKDACSEEDLDMNDFWSTDMYFGCPLKKAKNN